MSGCYEQAAPGGGLVVRLYTLEGFFDKLGGSFEKLLEADDEEYHLSLGSKFRDHIEAHLKPDDAPPMRGFPFIGVAVMDSDDVDMDVLEGSQAVDDTGYGVAALLGLGPDDYYPIPPNDEDWSVMEEDAFLPKLRPPEAPQEVVAELEADDG